MSAFTLEWYSMLPTGQACRLAVGDIDGDGVAEILCSTDELWVFDGVTGDLEWESTAFDENSPIILTDLDGDGVADVAGMSPTGTIVALDGAGAVLWESIVDLGQQYVNIYGHATEGIYPSLVPFDLNGDGAPELVTGRGAVSGRDGALVTWLSDEDEYHYPRDLLIGDPDLDGHTEICDHFQCRSTNGALDWELAEPSGLDRGGWPMAVQADTDPEAEILWWISEWAILTEADGTEIFRNALESEYWPNRPAIADFDGDGISEICADDDGTLKVTELDGTELWSLDLDPSGYGHDNTCVADDLDGDGDPDVLLSHEHFWGAFDGRTGDPLVVNTDWLSGDVWEMMVVIDLDGDGAAEIITGCEPSADGASGSANPTPRVAVYSNPDGAWAPTFPLWPYETYSGVGMNADGTVQRTADPSWTTTGLWRGSPANPILGFDLLPEITDACVSSCTDPEGQIRLAVRLVDLGPYEAPESTAFTVYALQEDGSRTRLETVTLADIAASAGDWFDGAPYVDNGFASPTYEVVTTFEVAQHGLEIVAGDHGAGNLPVDECAEENNTLSWSPAELCEQAPWSGETSPRRSRRGAGGCPPR